MEHIKSTSPATIIFPASILFCLTLGFTAPGFVGTLLALIPIAVCLIEVLELEALPQSEDGPGDWSALIEELREPVRVRVAAPVWNGWLPMVAGLAREADPVREFEVEWTTRGGRRSRKRIPERLIQAEFARLARGGYSGIRVKSSYGKV